jgi:hypothetical protein
MSGIVQGKSGLARVSAAAIAYNQGMDCLSAPRTPALRIPRSPRVWVLALSAAGLTMAALPVALAQVPPPPVAAEAPAATRTPEPTTQRIVHHDAGSRIEELRVGGQTRSIEVETNSRLPGYRVQPIDPAQAPGKGSGAGQSSWRVLNF